MAKQAANNAAMDASEPQSGIWHVIAGVPGRLLRGVRARPLLALFLLCGAGIIVAAGITAAQFVISQIRAAEKPVTVALALSQLDSGQYDSARQSAMQLNREAGQSFHRQGAALFVLGIAFADEAARHWNQAEKETLNLVAARYLEEANDRGFPPGRAAQGTFQLAKCLYLAGRYAESLPVLQRAMEQAPEQRYEINRLLAIAYYKDEPPQLDKARKFIRLALQDPSLTATQRDKVLLRQAEIELAAGDDAAADKTLDQISSNAEITGTATLLRARVRMQQAAQLVGREADSKRELDPAVVKRYNEALQLLRDASGRDLSGEITRQARYLTGICYHQLHDEHEAEAALVRTRRTHYHTPEAVAARLAEGEIQLSQGRYDVALESFLDVITEAGLAATYQNPWVSLKQLQIRLQLAYDALVSAKEFDRAVKLAQALADITSADVALLAEARAQGAWGDQLMRTAASLDPPQAAVTCAEGRIHYRQAGDAFQRLAELRFATKYFVEDLWHGGNYMLLGHNYESALIYLQRYLASAPRDQRARGLVALGEAEMSLGQLRAARESLRQCVRLYPKHPDTYRARLLAAQICEALARGEDPNKDQVLLQEAEDLLKTNLYGVSLTPLSPQWRASLFQFGRLLYREATIHEAQGDRGDITGLAPAERRDALAELATANHLFQECIEQLSEYVARDENGPHVGEARYLVAEAWRHSARFPQVSTKVEPTQARRVELTRQVRKYLQASAAQYQELQQLLNQRQQEHTLSDLERRILRNTYFAYADALFDLKDYKQAVKAYSAATNRYQHEPVALEAFMQIASCYRRMNSPEQAHSTVMHAVAVLSRIRQDAEFARTTRYSREQWDQFLTWLAKW